MTSAAEILARWAAHLEPEPGDVKLADRSLRDTVAVALAARHHRVTRLAASLPECALWAVAGHVLDFDDLHMPSTTHVSAVCVPAALATGGGPRAYLAAAGVMARLGTALGWAHYSAGWHATCTAGAPAVAAGAAVAFGLPAEQIAVAMALAVPAAGGVQRAFGTDAKSLQVGFAVDAGIRAARLAAAGARADPSAVDAWLGLAGGERRRAAADGPAAGRPRRDQARARRHLAARRRARGGDPHQRRDGRAGQPAVPAGLPGPAPHKGAATGQAGRLRARTRHRSGHVDLAERGRDAPPVPVRAPAADEPMW
jgi:MmgE/PrpD N-terminal domain